MYILLDDKLYLAPISDHPQRVLDIGTGTGIWAIDFADQFPSAEVIGTDLSPIQPRWVPPNCKFELDDADLEWMYPDNHFDYVHIRYMIGSIKDWPKLYKQAFRCLKPGGILEHIDYELEIKCDDGTMPDDCIWHDWSRLFVDSGEKLGRTFAVIHRSNGWMEEAGFQD